MAHRKAPEADRHLYQITLGSAQGIEGGDTVEIRREQHTRSQGGEDSRTERVIATGVVTNQVVTESAWVAIDPSKASDAILQGDVVRPVKKTGLLSSLSGPNCKKILEER